MKVEKGSWVEIAYEIVDGEGEVVESSQDEPIQYVQGEEQIFPGLERALEGHEAGDTFTVTLTPDEAFGDYDVEGLFSVPRADFPPDAELVPGDLVEVQVEPEEGDEPGAPETFEVRVEKLDGDSVILDANHPLAGRDVTFRVAVQQVRAATPEEIEEARTEC
jgi:FKBP-type peptidyl-prolyl cis-trans isomerase SlyD